MRLVDVICESETSMVRDRLIVSGIVDQYNFLHEWEDREREMDLYPFLNTDQTREILMVFSLLIFFQEATSLKGNSTLLV